MTKQNIVYLIFLFFILVFITSCENLEEDLNTPRYENSIKIGVVGDVSVLREQVESMFFGAKLASEEINQNGGIEIDNETFHLELIYKNSGGSPEEGILVTQELINDDVNLIVGPTFSSVAIEMAELCVENQALMMSYAATTPELTFLNDDNLIWRTCPSDNTFGNISAQYAFDSLDCRKAAIFYRDDRFGQGLSAIIKDMFVELGGRVTNYVSFPGDITNLATYNFSYELNSLLNQEVDVIYIIAFNSEIAVLTNEIYNNELYQNFEDKPYIFVNNGIIAEELIVNGNPELLKTIVGITSTNEGNPNYTLYKDNFISRFGFGPATYSEHAYDALYCLAYGMLRANSSDPNAVKNYLKEISGLEQHESQSEQITINVNEFHVAKNIIQKGQTINYDGASGPINFDNNGDPIPKIVIWGIKSDEFVELSYYGK